jgi:hypothetical protein
VSRLLVALASGTRVAGSPRRPPSGRRIQKLRGLAEELDSEVDLAGNLSVRVLRRHNETSVGL